MAYEYSILEVYRIIRCHPPEHLQFSCRVCNIADIVEDGSLGLDLLGIWQHLVYDVNHVVIVERNSPDDVDYLEWGCIVELYACRIACSRVSGSASDADALAHERAVQRNGCTIIGYLDLQVICSNCRELSTTPEKFPDELALVLGALL